MTRTIAVGLVLSASAIVTIPTGRFGIETRAAAAQARPVPATEVPRFQVDPAWPKIPNNWQFGQVASVSIDAQDHVWVLQRPGTLSAEEKPGPLRPAGIRRGRKLHPGVGRTGPGV